MRCGRARYLEQAQSSWTSTRMVTRETGPPDRPPRWLPWASSRPWIDPLVEPARQDLPPSASWASPSIGNATSPSASRGTVTSPIICGATVPMGETGCSTPPLGVVSGGGAGMRAGRYEPGSRGQDPSGCAPQGADPAPARAQLPAPGSNRGRRAIRSRRAPRACTRVRWLRARAGGPRPGSARALSCTCRRHSEQKRRPALPSSSSQLFGQGVRISSSCSGCLLMVSLVGLGCVRGDDVTRRLLLGDDRGKPAFRRTEPRLDNRPGKIFVKSRSEL